MVKWTYGISQLPEGLELCQLVLKAGDLLVLISVYRSILFL